MEIPAALDWLRRRDDGRRWIDALDGVVASCADRWELTIGDPVPDAQVSDGVPAER